MCFVKVELMSGLLYWIAVDYTGILDKVLGDCVMIDFLDYWFIDKSTRKGCVFD